MIYKPDIYILEPYEQVMLFIGFEPHTQNF